MPLLKNPACMQSSSFTHPLPKHSRHLTLTSSLAFALPAFVLRFSDASMANYAYILLVAWCFLGPRASILALLCSWFFTHLNPGIAPLPSHLALDRILVIIAAASSILFTKLRQSCPFQLTKLTIGTLGITSLLLAHAYFTSLHPLISALKTILWAGTICTLFEAWRMLDLAERESLARTCMLFLAVIMLISLPLIPLSLGSFRNGTGFQGLFNHPQAAGISFALLGVWTFSQAITLPKHQLRHFSLGGLALTCIFLTEARTAALALTASLTLALLTFALCRARNTAPWASGLHTPIFRISIIAVASASALFASPIIHHTEHFLFKSGRAQTSDISQIYKTSRGQLTAPMQANIIERPFFGIGFGIASRPQDRSVANPILAGIPLVAATEKGVLPLMLLEELGIFLTLICAAFLFLLLRQSAVHGFTAFSLVLCTYFLNMGEATLFSTGGMGLLLLILIAWATAPPDQPSPPQAKHRPKTKRAAA